MPILKVSRPEEIALRQGWIDAAQLRELALPLAKDGYGQYCCGYWMSSCSESLHHL